MGLEAINNPPKNVTAVEAAALKKDTRISQAGYEEIRRITKAKGSNLFPPSNQVREAENSAAPFDIKSSSSGARTWFLNNLFYRQKRNIFGKI